MKKKSIYITCIVVFCIAVAGIIFGYTQKKKSEQDKTYTLLERKGSTARTKEWQETKKKASDLLAALKNNPADQKSAVALAALYIQEGRETGNYAYYNTAAMKYVDNVLQADPYNFNALVFKSLVYLSQHHFAEGLATARAAQQVNPYNAYVYGLLVDGNVEMGRYDSAVIYADKMVAIRPDLTSYSRISYLREIFGDYPGAIKAMKMAVEAGGRGDEHTEWTRVQLGSLYEKTGDFKSADSAYQVALAVRPDYPYALAGLGRIATAKGNATQAITYFEQANSLIADNSFKEELIDLYRQTGNTKKADELADAVINEMEESAKAGQDDDNIGHYADRELAYAYLKVNKFDKALERAMMEYNRRPDNIDVNESVAWVLYHKGEYAKALEYMKAALKTNSKNPVLLSRAGMIYFKAGNRDMAKSLLNQASTSKSYIGQMLQSETSKVMGTL